jgi:phosphoglycerate dehydrogenase-like enzyme
MADSAATSFTVGWIGTGRMGQPLAERLAREGVPLAVACARHHDVRTRVHGSPLHLGLRLRKMLRLRK